MKFEGCGLDRDGDQFYIKQETFARVPGLYIVELNLHVFLFDQCSWLLLESSSWLINLILVSLESTTVCVASWETAAAGIWSKKANGWRQQIEQHLWRFGAHLDRGEIASKDRRVEGWGKSWLARGGSRWRSRWSLVRDGRVKQQEARRLKQQRLQMKESEREGRWSMEQNKGGIMGRV